jgi:hypothetical protein
LEESELAEGEKQGIQIFQKRVMIRGSMGYLQLLCELGDMFGVTVAFSWDKDVVIVSARSLQMEMFDEMTSYLTEEIVKEAQKVPIRSIDLAPGEQAASANFVDGICISLCQKIERQRAGNLDRRLPVITEQAATEEHLKSITELTSVETKSPEVTLETIFGMLAGDSISINRKVES